jgi:uncharacterized protein YjbI with pentapeptide repeats
MANQQHLELFQQGAEIWNAWRKEHPEIQPDLCSTDTLKVKLSHLDLSNFDLNHTTMMAVELVGANFSGTDLRGACFTMAHLREANFTGANVSNAYFGEADLTRANFSAADLREAIFHWATCSGTQLKEAKNLHQADFTSAYFRSLDLSGTNLAGAQLDFAEFHHVDLRETNLSHANLCGARLHEANLQGANLQGAFLGCANLVDAHLSHANLTNAYLVAAKLYGADCCDAHFQGANLSRANLVWANLTRAILTNCRIYGISAWNIQVEGAVQKNIILTDEGQPTITIDDVRIAQFVHLYLTSQEIRAIVNSFTTRVVLTLMHPTTEHQHMLEALGKALRLSHYHLLLFDVTTLSSQKDLDVLDSLVSLARFLLVDLPALPPVTNKASIGLQPLVMDANIQDEETVLKDLKHHYHWILPTVHLKDMAALQAWLAEQVFAPLEEKTAR